MEKGGLVGAFQKAPIQDGRRVDRFEALVDRPVRQANEAWALLAVLEATRALDFDLIRQPA